MSHGGFTFDSPKPVIPVIWCGGLGFPIWDGQVWPLESPRDFVFIALVTPAPLPSEVISSGRI